MVNERLINFDCVNLGIPVQNYIVGMSFFYSITYHHYFAEVNLRHHITRRIHSARAHQNLRKKKRFLTDDRTLDPIYHLTTGRYKSSSNISR